MDPEAIAEALEGKVHYPSQMFGPTVIRMVDHSLEIRLRIELNLIEERVTIKMHRLHTKRPMLLSVHNIDVHRVVVDCTHHEVHFLGSHGVVVVTSKGTVRVSV